MADNLPETAYHTSRIKKAKQIPYAEELAPPMPAACAFRHLLKRVICKKEFLQMSEIITARHRAIDKELDRLFEKYNGKIAVLEVAAGFSPRGFSFAQKGIPLYWDTDLDIEIVAEKQRLFKKAIKKHQCPQVENSCQIFQLDVLSPKISAVLKLIDTEFPDYPLVVIAEGLIGHFDETQRNIFLKQLSGFRRQNSAPLYFIYPVKFGASYISPRENSRLFKFILRLTTPKRHYNTRFMSTPKKARRYFMNKGFPEVSFRDHDAISIILCKK